MNLFPNITALVIEKVSVFVKQKDTKLREKSFPI